MLRRIPTDARLVLRPCAAIPGSMIPGVQRFADEALEREFLLSERASKIRMVRRYCILVAAVVLGYGLIIPLFFTREDEFRFSLLLFLTLAVLAGYVALTYWSRYAERPQIDFLCLLAIGFLIFGENVLLWNEAALLAGSHHANLAINTSLVTAFAAIVLCDRLAWFAAWLACHAAAFVGLVNMVEASGAGTLFAVLSYLTGAAIAIFIAGSLGHAHRAAFALQRMLDSERATSEELLRNALPASAVERLKEGKVVADSYSDASVVFIDLVGFTDMAARVSPGHLIELLNGFFGHIDRCASAEGVEKVKTIGDAYLAVAGASLPVPNSADAAIAFAKAVIAGMDGLREATGLPVRVRIGIHTGPVCGGVIGSTRIAYDYWGETINMASRIEGAAEPDSIAVSERTFFRTLFKSEFSGPHPVSLPGVGEAAIYRMVPAAAAPSHHPVQ